MGENPDGDPDATLLRRRPASCLLVSDHWDATRSWGEILTLKSGDEYAVHNCTVLAFIDGSGLPDQLFVGTRRFVPIPYVENVIKCIKMCMPSWTRCERSRDVRSSTFVDLSRVIRHVNGF